MVALFKLADGDQPIEVTLLELVVGAPPIVTASPRHTCLSGPALTFGLKAGSMLTVIFEVREQPAAASVTNNIYCCVACGLACGLAIVVLLKAVFGDHK